MTEEAYVGLFLVRVGLPVACLVVSIWSHLRISRFSRDRLEFPTKLASQVALLKADITALDLQISGLIADLKSHKARDSATASRERRGTNPAAPGAAPAGNPMEVTPEAWANMGCTQRKMAAARGFFVAAGNGAGTREV